MGLSSSEKAENEANVLSEFGTAKVCDWNREALNGPDRVRPGLRAGNTDGNFGKKVQNY